MLPFRPLLRNGRSLNALNIPSPGQPIRAFAITAPSLRQQMPPRPKPPPEEEIEESYLKGSGPGGQKINKTSSAVQLKHIPTGIVVKSQATRSRTENRKIARSLLAERLDNLYNGDESRSAIVGEAKKKKAASAAKKSRRKYKKLDEAAQKTQETRSQDITTEENNKQPEEESNEQKPASA